MAQEKKPSLESLWTEAKIRYEEDVRRYEEEYRRTHNHAWNRVFKHKKPQDEPLPVLALAKDFEMELSRREATFKKMRKGNHKVFAAMSSLATPVEIIGGQAAAVGDMFAPGASMVFGAVMYLFNAGRDVSANYNILEDLFTKCSDAITQISQLVDGVRFLPVQLQRLTIETLIAILNVFRIATTYARDGRLKAYAQALAAPGEGGEAKVSLAYLIELGKKRDTTVGISTYVAIDLLDAKHDRTDGKIDYVTSLNIDIRNTVTQVSTQMNQILANRREGDKAPSKKTKDVKQLAEEKAQNKLKGLLAITNTIPDRIKEFTKSTAPGTCEWIFEEAEFQAWKSRSDIPILWVYGKSGAGKTHLAAHISTKLWVSDKPSPSKVPVVTYFCEYIDREQYLSTESPLASPSSTRPDRLETATKSPDSPRPNGTSVPADPIDKANVETPEAALEEPVTPKTEEAPSTGPEYDETLYAAEAEQLIKALSWQLCEEDKRYERELTGHLSLVEERTGYNSSLREKFSCLFQNNYFAGLQGRFVTLVIDGFDNITRNDRFALYALLRELIPTKDGDNTTIKIIALSQPTLKQEVEQAFTGYQMPTIIIDKEKNRADIEKYVSWTVKQSSKLSRALRSPTLRKETVKKVAETTQGVFEMGALLLKQLSQKDHVDLFSEILQKPPKDIQSILRQTLIHFGQTHTAQDIEDLNSLLAWVMYGQYSLSLAELNSAVGMESEHGEFLDIRDKVAREFSAYFSIVDRRTGQVDLMASEPEPVLPLSKTALDDTAESVIEDPSDDLDVQTVKVAHASIAKYFRNAGSVGIQEKGISMGINREQAHLRIAKVCLRVICAVSEPLKPWQRLESADKLLFYAAYHFRHHLAQARPAAVLADKVEIFRLLVRVFRDQEIISRWIGFSIMWPFWYNVDYDGDDNEIWWWFSDPEMRKELKPEETTWLTKPCPSETERLMRPIAIWFASKWLQDPAIRFNDEAIYNLVHLSSLVRLFEDAMSKQPGNATGAFNAVMAMKTDEVLKFAEWAGFEKTALWHTRVGYNITDIIQPASNECLEQYRLALKIDPAFGAAHFAMATYSGQLGNYDFAIEEMNEARRLKYNVEGGSDVRASIWIAKWQAERSDTQEAKLEGMKTLEAELERHPTHFACIATYIQIASSAGQNRSIMAVIQKLGDKLVDFLLSDSAEDLHKSIRRAAQKMKRVGVLKKAYEAAIPRCNEGKDLEIRILDAAAVLYHENQEEDKAIAKYAAMVDVADDLDGNYSAVRAANRIAEIQFASLQNATLAPAERAHSLAELEKIDKEDHNPSLTLERFARGLLLALHYRLEGDSEKANMYFKERFEMAKKLLSDDDKDNDYQGWEILMNTLFKAGDLGNGVAAAGKYHECIKQLEIQAAEQDDSESVMEMSEVGNEEESIAEEPTTTNGSAVLPTKTNGTANVVTETNRSAGHFPEKRDSKEPRETTITPPMSPASKELPPEPIPTRSPLRPKTEPPTPVSPTDATNPINPANPSPPTPATSPTDPTDDDPYPDTPWTIGGCDGLCDRNMSLYTKGTYTCTYCVDTFFCDTCYESHMKNELQYVLCDSDHVFVYTVGENKELGEEGKVKVRKIGVGELGDNGDRGVIREEKEWLEEIWKGWGV